MTKSTDERSDFSNGQASKPYRRKGIHLLFKSCNTTSSDAIRPTFPNMALAERKKPLGVGQGTSENSRSDNKIPQISHLAYPRQ